MTLSLHYGMWAIKSKYILLFRNTLCYLLKFDYCFIYVMNIKKKLPHSQTVRYTTIKTLELKVHPSVSTWSRFTRELYNDASRAPPKLPFFPGQRAGRAGGFRSLKNTDLQIAVRGRLRVYTSFPYLARALGLAGENFRSARAQNLTDSYS